MTALPPIHLHSESLERVEQAIESFNPNRIKALDQGVDDEISTDVPPRGIKIHVWHCRSCDGGSLSVLKPRRMKLGATRFMSATIPDDSRGFLQSFKEEPLEELVAPRVDRAADSSEPTPEVQQPSETTTMYIIRKIFIQIL